MTNPHYLDPSLDSPIVSRNLELDSSRFDKSKRLLTPSHFKNVFDNAKVRAATKNFLLLATPGQTDVSRLGVIVAKKHVRLAVNRNKFKRIMREHFRIHTITPSYDFVILIRSRQVKYENVLIQQDLMLLWRRFEKNAQEKKPS